MRNAARAAVEEQHAAESLVRQVAGQSFVDVGGERKLVVDADGLSLTVCHVEEGVARREAGQWQISFANAVRTGQIRPAAEGDIEAFAQTSACEPINSTDSRCPRVTTEAVTEHLSLLRGGLRRFSPTLARMA